jgi:hypothetical protein
MRHCLALCTARAPLATIFTPMHIRSYWIPGSYAPALSEKCNSFLRLLKNKGFKEERMTKVGWHAIGKSTTLESNKSPPRYGGEKGTTPYHRKGYVGPTFNDLDA